MTSIVTADNGCEVLQTIPVVYDTLMPSLILNPDTLTCFNPSINLVNAQLSDRYIYEWSGASIPDTMAEILNVIIPDEYRLNITDTVNHCENHALVTIGIDTISPTYQIIKNDSLTCMLSSFQAEIITDPSSSINWTGPDVDGLTERIVTVARSGNYRFNIRGINGCVNGEAFDVVSDIDGPDITVSSLYNITCDQENFNVLPLVNTVNTSLTWESSSGNHGGR